MRRVELKLGKDHPAGMARLEGGFIMKSLYLKHAFLFLLLSLVAACGGSNNDTTDDTPSADTSPPDIVASITPEPNSNDWHRTDVTVSFVCIDDESGVESCPADVVLTDETIEQLVAGTARDRAGNTATTEVVVSIDKTSPLIESSSLPSPNAAGWINSDVFVTFDCSDSLSGIDNCSDLQTITSEGINQIITGNATDRAGNTATTEVTLKIDKTPPVIGASTPTSPSAAGWFDDDVTVEFSCSDTLSGVDVCPATNLFDTEGANQEIAVSATDLAGNRSSILFSVNIDKTAPEIRASTSKNPNAQGWFNDDVIVEFECSDTLSGVGSCTNSQEITTEGSNQIIVGIVSDLAGNAVTTEVQLNIDKTAPEITVNTPSPAQRIFGYLPPVKVEGTATDELSGLASLSCNGAPISLNGTEFACDADLVDGENTIMTAATDRAGNSAVAERQVTYLQPQLELAFYDTHQIVWSSYGAELTNHASFFVPVTDSLQPVTTEGFHLLGHFGYQGLVNVPNGYTIAAREIADSAALAKPLGYTKVWDSVTTGLGAVLAGAFWKPLPPVGYGCLGLLVTNDINLPPANDAIRCVRDDVLIAAYQIDGSYETQVLWNTGFGVATTPFLSKLVLPDKSNPLVRHAIYPGTFNGSNYNSIYQDAELMHWLDGEKVLHTNLPAADVEPLIEHIAPLVWLDPEEVFFPDAPEFILNIADLNKAIIAYESNYDLFQPLNHQLMKTWNASFTSDLDTFVYNDPDFYLNDTPPLMRNPFFKHWISYDPLSAFGDLSRTLAYVNVLPVDAIFTDFQFWFYYPYNGPGRITLTIGGYGGVSDDFQLEVGGQHFGDWEHVTMRILNKTPTMSQHELVGVYMSRHSAGQWFSRKFFGTQLGFNNTQPIVYAGKYSHAFYPLVHEHIVYERTIAADGFVLVDSFDETGLGYLLDISTFYEIVNSGVPGVTTVNKPWLQFEGRWGGYIKTWEDVGAFYDFQEVGAGPYGPNVKHAWKYGDSFEWYWSVKVTEK